MIPLIATLLFLPLLTSFIPKDIEPYVEDVYKISEGNLDGKSLDYNFYFLDNQELGFCFEALGRVGINRKYWYKLSEKDKILLIAHEIAHCVKSADHVDTKEGICYTNFMSSYSTTDECTNKYYEQYVEQMKEL